MAESRRDRKSGRAARLVRVWLAVAVVAVAVVSGACTDDEVKLPEEVLGTWTSSDPPYEGRSFRIRRDSVFFETAEGFFEGYAIEEVKVTTEEGRLLFTILYESQADKPYQFSFFYSSPEGGEIRFKNRTAVGWHRQAGGAAPEPEEGGGEP